MIAFDDKAVQLMYWTADAELHPWLDSTKRQLERESVDREELMASDPFKNGVKKFTELFSKIDGLEIKQKSHDHEILTLTVKSEELETLKREPIAAYENYVAIADNLLSERKTKAKELEELDKKLSAAGRRTLTNPGWARATLAIVFALAIAAGIFFFMSVMWGKKPEASLEVSYDIAKMIEALLLGSGALIAGVAYAISTLRPSNR